MEKERQLTDHELSKPVMILAQQFVQRWDLHARQLDDGRYVCIHKPLNVDHLFRHLRGEITLGTYLLNPQSEARFIVFDADNEYYFSTLISMREQLETEDIPTYLETSRRGGHLWFFFEQAIPGRQAREFGCGLLSFYGNEKIEIFPKQDQLSGGPGSLIRMPFGVHRQSGQRYGFLDLDGKPLAPTIRQQIQVLSAPQNVPNKAFEVYQPSSIPLSLQTTSLEATDSPRDVVSIRIKNRISVLEFVGEFVDLQPTNKGAIGLCPFHEDHKPSLSINVDENYWHCFAGCGGGSIIDFWMIWTDSDFVEAVTELAEILL